MDVDRGLELEEILMSRKQVPTTEASFAYLETYRSVTTGELKFPFSNAINEHKVSGKGSAVYQSLSVWK